MPIAARISVNPISPRESSVGTTTRPGVGVGVPAGDVGVAVGVAVGVGVGVPGGDVRVAVGIAVGVGVGACCAVVTARPSGLLNPVAAPESVRVGAVLPLAVRL
jgi:hypothetical protein